MKKILCVGLVFATLLLQTSCTNNTAKKAIEQGKLAMASTDYQSSLKSLQLAKEEGGRGEELDNMISVLENYLEAKEALEAANIDSANEALGRIPENYTDYVISGDIDKLKEEVSKKHKVMADVDSQISGTKKMLANGDYTSASANIAELYSKEMTGYQRRQVDELNSTIQSAQSKIDDASAKKPEVVYVPQTPPKSSNNNVAATYYVVNCKQSITLRTEPSTSASEITQIPLGQAVGYIENAGNGFYKINYDGAIGYSLASYLSASKPNNTASSGTSYTYAKVVNAEEFITLRSSPSTTASEITKIPAGAYVTYLGTAANGFYNIEYNGMSGYGLQSYLEIQ